jgi:putative phosphoribosyl transferase
MLGRYHNRTEAGRRLARALGEYAAPRDALVLALPRGGVPVGAEVARALEAPLDVFVVRKLGVPAHPELAMGAIATGGVRIVDRVVMDQFGVTDAELAAVAAVEEQELERRERLYRDGRALPDVAGRTVILVDDGLATGATMSAAATALRAHRPNRLVVAVPIAPPETCAALRELVDEVVCAATPEPFLSVSLWYQDFSETSDEEVRELLARAARERPSDLRGASQEREVQVDAWGTLLSGVLAIPPGARGVVLFAHGSGSGRHSPRNRFVAERLREAGMATLLVDLLTPPEEAVDVRTLEIRFDIARLGERLTGAIDWLEQEPETRGLPVGLFGASTGAAAALVAAAARTDVVKAVVSRGGRPDLAGGALERVRAPSLFIVGGRDDYVLELNHQARRHMHAPVRLELVHRATHLFEEPGALDTVARLAGEWFVRHLGATEGGVEDDEWLSHGGQHAGT